MNINNTKDLDDAIALLKIKQENEARALKNNFNEIVELFKPKNLIKSAFENATEGRNASSILLKAAAGIGGSLLKNGLKVANNNSILGIATSALKSSAAGIALNNSDKVIAWGTAIFNSFKNKKNNDIQKNTQYINMIDEKVNASINDKSTSDNLITTNNGIDIPKKLETDVE
jgi:hypothetical protein